MTDDLFTDDQPTIDQNKNYLDELVGDGKKFRSPEDLARGKYESDSYIKILERRLDDMRNDYIRLDTDYKARASLQEVVDQLTNPNKQPPTNSDNPSERGEDTARFDPNKIAEIVKAEAKAEFQRNEAERKQQDNYNLLEKTLKERFGDSYKTAFKSSIDKAGISEDLAKNLALNHPSVLLKAIGLDGETTRESYQNPIQSERRSEGFAPQTGPKRTWSYYQKMKKEQPEVYNQPKIAVQMQEDYALLGKEFEDGDFNA